MMISLDVLSKYNEGNDYSRNQLLKLRKFLNSQVLDQIPILNQLRIYLEQLSLVQQNIQSNFSPVVIFQQSTWFSEFQNQLSEINWQFNESFLNLKKKNKNSKYSKAFDSLLEKFFDTLDLKEQKFLRKKAEKKRLDEIGQDSNKETKENIKSNDPLQKCAKCLKPAEKRCSDCKKYFYCSKNCQKKDLKSGHKNDCLTHSNYVKKCIEFLKKKKKSSKSQKTKENLKSNKLNKKEIIKKKTKIEIISESKLKNEIINDVQPEKIIYEDPLGFDELD